MALSLQACGAVSDPGKTATQILDTQSLGTGVAFSPDGTLLAMSTFYDPATKSVLNLWEMDGSKARPQPTTLSGHTDNVNALTFSPDGQWLASAGADTTVRLWSMSQPDDSPVVLTSTSKWVEAVAFSADGNLLTAGNAGSGIVRVWQRVPGGWEVQADLSVNISPSAVAFSPDGARFVAPCDIGAICMWSTGHWNAPAEMLKGHSRPITSLAFSEDGKSLISGGFENNVMLWDLSKKPIESRLVGNCGGTPETGGIVEALLFGRTQGQVIAGCGDNSVRIWNTLSTPNTQNQSTSAPIILSGHFNRVTGLALHPTLNLLASTSDDGTVRLWNLDQ